MLRRASKLGRQEAELARRNWDGWDVVPEDVLLLVAQHAVDGKMLNSMYAVCSSWRSILSDHSAELWKARLHKSAATLLSKIPSLSHDLCFKTYYSQQLTLLPLDENEVRRSLGHQPTCSLSDFTFTFEFVEERQIDASEGRIRSTRQGDAQSQRPAHTRRTVLSSFTGPLGEPISADACEFRVPLNWKEWEASWDQAGRNMRLYVYVTRVIRGQPQTIRIWRSDPSPHDGHEDGDVFYSTSLARAMPFTDEDDYALVPELGLTMPRDFDGTLDPVAPESISANHDCFFLQFKTYVPESHYEEMQMIQLLRYLEFNLPWRSRWGH